MSRDRIPPHNLEAEAALLGACLVDRELVPVVAAIVTVGDFYAPAHAPIFSAILRLYDAGQPVDKITLAGELGRVKRLEKSGGVSYLSSLMDSVQTASSAEYYAKIVAEKAILRRLITTGARITELGYEGEVDVAEAVTAAERELFSAVVRANTSPEKSLAVAVRDAWDALGAVSKQGQIAGLTSPWPRFDEYTGRTHPGELVAWGAAPQAGKSIAVSQLAMHVARQHGAVAFFALEMGVADTVRRILAKEAGLSSRRLRLGDVRGAQWDSIGTAMDSLIQVPITFFDRFPPKSVKDVRRCVARMAMESPVKAVIIDHANFLSDAMNQGRNSKHERLDAVYQELLQIGAEFGCVMHVVQHLNREGMNNKPSLNNLRDGGNLEGHAHIVVFPYRPNIECDPELGEFIIAKNRDGEVAALPMTFDGAHLEWRERQAVAA